MMREKFAEFIAKYAVSGSSESKLITEQDVKEFFKDLDDKRKEHLKQHIENAKEKK